MYTDDTSVYSHTDGDGHWVGILAVAGARDGRDGGSTVQMAVVQAGGVAATVSAMRGHRMHALTQEHGARLIGTLAAVASSAVASLAQKAAAGPMPLHDRRRVLRGAPCVECHGIGCMTCCRTGVAGGGDTHSEGEASERDGVVALRNMLQNVGVGTVRLRGVEALLDAIVTHATREDGENRPSDVVYFSCWALVELAALPIVDDGNYAGGQDDDFVDSERVGVLVGKVLRAPSPTTASSESEGRRAMTIIASRVAIGHRAVLQSFTPRFEGWLTELLML